MPAPDTVEIEYRVQYDVSADNLCAMTGFCDCEVVYGGVGTTTPTKPTPGRPQTYEGTWRKVSGSCHEALEMWVPADGKARHSLTVAPDGALTQWVAHQGPDPTRLTSNIKAGGQVWLAELKAPFVDGVARHTEDAAGDVGGLGLASHHTLQVKRSKGAPAEPPSGNTTASYVATYTFPDEAPQTCQARNTCPCEVRGEFRGSPVADIPEGQKIWRGTWTPGASTCDPARVSWTLPPGDTLLQVGLAADQITWATLMPWAPTGIQNDDRPQLALGVHPAAGALPKGGHVALQSDETPSEMFPVGPGQLVYLRYRRVISLELRGLGP